MYSLLWFSGDLACLDRMRINRVIWANGMARGGEQRESGGPEAGILSPAGMQVTETSSEIDNLILAIL